MDNKRFNILKISKGAKDSIDRNYHSNEMIQQLQNIIAQK